MVSDRGSRRPFGSPPDLRLVSPQADRAPAGKRQAHRAPSQASPQERIVFALTKPSEIGKEATVGEMYIKDQQLHFILNCYRLPSEGNEFVSACQGISRQGFVLSFLQQEFLVGFGKPRLLLGNSTKELVIDFGGIPSSATSGS